MAFEEGIVVRTGTNRAWVEAKSTGSCENCANRSHCNPTSTGAMEVEAADPVGVKEGDRVVMQFDTSSLLKLTFLLYIVPVLFMIFGAAVGNHVAPNYGKDPSVMAAIFGFSLLVASFLVVRVVGNRIAKGDRYRPRIIRIKRNLESCGNSR